MFVAASTLCFNELSLVDAVDKLNDLEFTAAEIAIDEDFGQIKPSFVADNLQDAITICRDTHRLDLGSYFVNIRATGDEFYRQFEACCKLAKATKVATITVPSAELGTPFNEEVEHLRRLVDFASEKGALVSILTQNDRLSEDPDTCAVICDNVRGLGVTLDPSTFIFGPSAGRKYERLIKYVYNVHLRDTSESDFQVRVGRGDIEYSRLVTLLRRQKYSRGLTVQMQPLPNLDHAAEMRKIRLLLESLL